MEVAYERVDNCANSESGFNRSGPGGVPEYDWWYGCSPTAGGMLTGWWDGRPGFENLYDGDASVWSTAHSMPDFNPANFTGTHSMVASWEHHTAGQENGFTYGDWQDSASYPDHAANPNCIADFMKTQNGGSYTDNIVQGLMDYAAWDNPATAVNESYLFDAWDVQVPYFGGGFGYDDMKAELSAGQPMLLDLMCYAPVIEDWVGHSVVAYGYQDDMFQIMDPAGGSSTPVTVGGFAIRDTWMNGTNQSSWWGWGGEVIYPVIDGDGVEWWPFRDMGGYSYGSRWDWMVVEGIYFQPVPEPSTLLLLAPALLGFAGLLRRRLR
jgi:hypothetical protein